MTIGVYFDESDTAKQWPGPEKVARNLIKGLKLFDINYKINLDGDINIILQNCNRLHGDLSNCYLGPNICTLPIDSKYVMNYDSYLNFIVPSLWVRDLYKKWIPVEKLIIWPTGIDTSKYRPINNQKKYDFLVYSKRRNDVEIQSILKFLNSKKMSYILVEYGKYNENQFLDIISECKYGLVIDNCESQGFAIQEMMSCDLPLLVWDIKYWIDRGEQYKCLATSIPYFNENCGETFFSVDILENTFNNFINSKYNPREYIVTNLSIESSTKKILKIIEYENIR